MAFGEDVEEAQESIQQPLIQANLNLTTSTNDNNYKQTGSTGHHPWMVYLSTFVAVCGSYEFGACVCYLFFLIIF